MLAEGYVRWTEWLTMSAHGSLVGSLLLTMVICLPLTDTWLSSMTLHIQTTIQDPRKVIHDGTLPRAGAQIL